VQGQDFAGSIQRQHHGQLQTVDSSIEIRGELKEVGAGFDPLKQCGSLRLERGVS
jgi:hypothetical protein